MIDRGDGIIDQPGEFKLETNGVENQNLTDYLLKRKNDVDNKLHGRTMKNFYDIGIVIKTNNDDFMYQIVGRLEYSTNGEMKDYKTVKFGVEDSNYYYFDHQDIEKAFKVEKKLGGKSK